MLFKKNKIAAPCACKGNNENCDLVLSLREKQKLSKQIKDEIEFFNKDSQSTLNVIVDFLNTLDKCGYSSYNSVYHIKEYKMTIVERAIDQYLSFDDIDNMVKKLSTYKTSMCMIAEKQKELKVVEDEIKDIKSKLGIE